MSCLASALAGVSVGLFVEVVVGTATVAAAGAVAWFGWQTFCR